MGSLVGRDFELSGKVCHKDSGKFSRKFSDNDGMNGIGREWEGSEKVNGNVVGMDWDGQ